MAIERTLGRFKTFKGRSTTWSGWGVIDSQGGVLYEADFQKEVAERIVNLENGANRPQNWEETRAILEREGFDVTPVSQSKVG